MLLSCLKDCAAMKLSLYPKYLIRSMFAHGRHSFFKEGYKLLYPECSRLGMTPWQHYVIYGKKKGFDNGNHPSAEVFFSEGYELEYPDVKAAGVDPWRHYAEKGAAEGRDNGLHPGSDLFSPESYAGMYTDVANSGVDPWRHYVLFGKKEGRDNGLHPEGLAFFAAGYKFNYPSCADEEYSDDLWMNYLKVGRKLGRNNGLSPAVPFFYGDYLELCPGRTPEQAWHDYVLNYFKNGTEGFNLYPGDTGVREVLKKKNPMVAVIMPTYNRKNVVMKAIASVQNQSWSNWHLYVVDDFSDDGTYEYLKSAISDPRITVLKSELKGVCGARNTAASHIRYEDYVAYLDSDNTWNREYLELMLCRLTETNTCCCYGALKRFQRESDGSVTVLGFLYEPFDINSLRIRNFIDQNVFMHRACVFREIGAFDTSLRRMVDWDLILRCAERYSFSRLPYVACNYDHTEDENRISHQGYSFTYNYMNVIRNKHWIDWEFLKDKTVINDKSLVSVILYCGKNDPVSRLKSCLTSLKNASLHSHSKYRSEIIVVDDSCNEAVHQEISAFSGEHLIDKYLVNKDECLFPLSCNRALNIADGSFVVYLDIQAVVSAGWLAPLVAPLTRHPELMGTTSMILTSGGAVSSIGCLFDPVSLLPYDILHELPSDLPAAKRLALLPCVNSCCCAFRTGDVVARKGLYSLYVSRLAIADLCLQLAGGKQSFAFIPSSEAVSSEECAEQPDDQLNDMKAFEERWYGKAVSDDQKFFDRRNLGKFIKGRKKVCSVSFKIYSKISCKKYSTDCFIPVYDNDALKPQAN